MESEKSPARSPKAKGKGKGKAAGKGKQDKVAATATDPPAAADPEAASEPELQLMESLMFGYERRAARVVAEASLKAGDNIGCPLPGCDSKGKVIITIIL